MTPEASAARQDHIIVNAVGEAGCTLDDIINDLLDAE